MATCFTWLLLAAIGVFVIASFIRWFEQTKEAVEHGWWNRVAVLVVFPFAVWIYPSRVSAGRPTPVPLHEPVRGFGTIPTKASPRSDTPPPETPPEFLVKPTPTPAKPKAPIDPAQVEKLKRKMREQGMMDE